MAWINSPSVVPLSPVYLPASPQFLLQSQESKEGHWLEPKCPVESWKSADSASQGLPWAHDVLQKVFVRPGEWASQVHRAPLQVCTFSSHTFPYLGLPLLSAPLSPQRHLKSTLNKLRFPGNTDILKETVPSRSSWFGLLKDRKHNCSYYLSQKRKRSLFVSLFSFSLSLSPFTHSHILEFKQTKKGDISISSHLTNEEITQTWLHVHSPRCG